MVQVIKTYTTEDAVNDYIFWLSVDDMADAYYKSMPPPVPGKVFDYDCAPHSKALRRIQKINPADSAGAILLLESVIVDLEDEGSSVSVKGLKYLQKLFSSKIRRDHLGALSLPHLMVSKSTLPMFPGKV